MVATQVTARNQFFTSLDFQPWLMPSGIVALCLICIAGFLLIRQRLHSKTNLKTMPTPPSEFKALKTSPEIAPALKSTEVNELTTILQDDQVSWIIRLRKGLTKSRQHLKENITRLLGNQKLDAKTLEQIHEVLFRSDLGVETADFLVEILRQRFGSNNEAPSWEILAQELIEAISSSMKSIEDAPINFPDEGPIVILVVGVNGVGKTTSIGKLAARYVAEGKSVMLCAGDTYRAAAIEQLQVWGDRIGVPIIKHQQGSDPASVVFDAVKAAKSRGIDVLLIDTAGRLHNKLELMEELSKIKRTITKEIAAAPHETWLVIDATTGQNAVQQVKAFGDLVHLSGLIVTKLDGTAKGGVIIGIKRRFKLPIRYIGIGEKAKDLKDFSAVDFANSLFLDGKN